MKWVYAVQWSFLQIEKTFYPLWRQFYKSLGVSVFFLIHTDFRETEKGKKEEELFFTVIKQCLIDAKEVKCTLRDNDPYLTTKLLSLFKDIRKNRNFDIDVIHGKLVDSCSWNTLTELRGKHFINSFMDENCSQQFLLIRSVKGTVTVIIERVHNQALLDMSFKDASNQFHQDFCRVFYILEPPTFWAHHLFREFERISMKITPTPIQSPSELKSSYLSPISTDFSSTIGVYPRKYFGQLFSVAMTSIISQVKKITNIHMSIALKERFTRYIVNPLVQEIEPGRIPEIKTSSAVLDIEIRVREGRAD